MDRVDSIQLPQVFGFAQEIIWKWEYHWIGFVRICLTGSLYFTGKTWENQPVSG
jgi:hypothetical protein